MHSTPHRWLAALPVVVLLTIAASTAASKSESRSLPKPPESTLTPAVFSGPWTDEAAILRMEQEEVERQRVADETAAEAARIAEEEATRQQAAARVPAPRATMVIPAPSVSLSGDCYGVNHYAAYIYMHESGCNPANPNNPNCEGIGQACPRGKMGCSWTDVSCQLAWFEGYAFSRYGSWEGAYQHWLANHWW